MTDPKQQAVNRAVLEYLETRTYDSMRAVRQAVEACEEPPCSHPATGNGVCLRCGEPFVPVYPLTNTAEPACGPVE